MNGQPSPHVAKPGDLPGPEVLFSIITPTFNPGQKLDATVASVFSQNADLYELLVVDGGSTDGTVESLARHAPRLRWWSEPDRGVYDAMNKGRHLARGRFLYFLGAGDRLRPGVLQAVANLLPANDQRLQLVYGDVDWPAFGGRYGGAFNAARLARHNICHQAIFYERGIFDLLGNYDLLYPTCADHALNIRGFGHPLIRPVYVNLVVADYEGGGISDAAGSDQRFLADWSGLVWRHLGLRAGLAHTVHHGIYRWGRWWKYHLRHAHELPGRIFRRLRHPAS